MSLSRMGEITKIVPYTWVRLDILPVCDITIHILRAEIWVLIS